MSTPQPPSHDPQHAPEEAARWFNQWHVYRAIVDANWMAHREIFSAVRKWVLMHYPGPFTLLDLGCGDAGFIKGTFDETGLWAYTGIDASQAALAKVRTELVGARFEVQLLEADMLAYLGGEPAQPAKTCDVILASFVAHHLPAREKQEFFRLAHAKLARGSASRRRQHKTGSLPEVLRAWWRAILGPGREACHSANVGLMEAGSGLAG